MAQKVDILASDQWFTNSDYEIDCYIKQADRVTAQNITGWALSWLVKKRSTDPDASAIITKTTDSGIVIVDGAAGHARILVEDDDTDATVQPGVYVHEVKRTDAGAESPVISGLAVLRRSAHLSG